MNKEQINQIDCTYIEVKPGSNEPQKPKLMSKKPVKVWTDENGIDVPYSRVTKAERLKERHTKKILRDAKSLSERLAKFKETVSLLCMEAYEAVMAEKNATGTTKGNFTFHNFDRSIKIEVNVKESIEFDDLTIQAAKSKFDDFLDKNLTSDNTFVKQLVLDAFSTQRSNKLDVKRVLSLVSYDKKINDPLFSEAVSLINDSIRRPKSKEYFRVYELGNDGSWQNIDLNFSSI